MYRGVCVVSPRETPGGGYRIVPIAVVTCLIHERSIQEIHLQFAFPFDEFQGASLALNRTLVTRF